MRTSAVLFSIGWALTSCGFSVAADAPGAYTSGSGGMLHGWFVNQNYAQLVANGHVTGGTISVDLYDPPILGGPTAGFLKFNDLVGAGPGQIPADSVVYKAELTLTTVSAGAGASIHRLLQPYSATMTWAGSFGGNGVQADDVEAAAAADVNTGTVQVGARTWDVTASVQAWVGGAANHGWVMLPLGINGWDFNAFDAPDSRPTLSVLFGPSQPRLALASGDVTHSSAVLLVQPTATGNVTLRVANDAGFADVIHQVVLPAPDLLVPAKTAITGLTAGTRYFFDAVDAAGAASMGEFSTAAGAGEFRGLRFGVSGDWRGELAPYPAVENIPGSGIDFFVALGDTIYADVSSPAVPVAQCVTLEEFRRKHAEVYGDAFGATSLADIRATTPWFSTIDDHEVTNDFAGGEHPSSDPRFASYSGDYINQTELYENGLRAFHEFHPIAEEFYGDTGDPLTADRRKLYRARTFGRDAAIFLLDARSFRDEEIPALGSSGAPNAAAWFANAFEPGRTMLGSVQLLDLKADLLAAEKAGVTWKFVIVPEPIQNLGPILGEDRFEGYAAERTDLLRYIDEHNLRNVVFIAADIHCTIVNNLTYQLALDEPQIATDMWEISTGAVAYAAPFGPTIADILVSIPVIGPIIDLIYGTLDRDGKDQLLADSIDSLLISWGFDPIGLDGSGVPATLLDGTWVSLHTYGWTEFDIAPDTQRLTVTTFGIDWYTRDELLADPIEVLSRAPEIVQQFTVEATPVPPLCAADLDGDGQIDLADLSTLLENFGVTSGATAEQGDIDGDGDVDLADLSALLTGFGQPCA